MERRQAAHRRLFGAGSTNGLHYAANPGEAWAEVYRILADRAAGLETALWPIVVGRYYPDGIALAAAERDIREPWGASGKRILRGRFDPGSARVWIRSLATPLDGTITATLSAPIASRHDFELLDARTKRTLARWSDWTRTTRTLTSTICGRRSVLLRVTRRVGSGPFSVAVTLP